MTPADTIAAEPAPRDRHARMLHYAWWQLRDYAIQRGFATLLLTGLAGLFGKLEINGMLAARFANTPPRVLIAEAGSVAAARAAMLAEANVSFLRTSVGIIVFVAAVLSMSGLVANDRRQGYYRFLFAKPVTPERYYGQAFVVHLAGFLVVVAVAAFAWGFVLLPVLSLRLLLVMGMMYVAYAGIGFFLTAVARWDWLSIVVVTVFARMMWAFFGGSASPAARLLYLLPPVHRFDAVYAALSERTALPWHTMWWLTGYGLVAFAAGLAVLRHRRLAIP